MATIRNEITIQRNFLEVFRYVSDFERAQEWQPAVIKATVSVADPVRIGTMISQTRKLNGRSIFMNADVVDFVRNKKIELKGIFIRYNFTRVIEFESGGMETRVRDEINIKFPILFFWDSPFVTGALRRQTREEWQTAKQLMETGARS